MSLQAKYLFDETSGATSFADDSGNGNTGTPSGSPVSYDSPVVAASTGKCIHLKGANSEYISLGSSALNITGTALTITAWVRVIAGGSGAFIIRRGNASTTQYAFYFNPFPRLYFIANNTTYFGPFYQYSAAWQHAAVTWDGANARFFIDGIFVGTTAASTTISSVSGAVTNIGTNLPLAAVTSEMEIDGLRVYNDTQSDAAIAAICAAEKPVYSYQMPPLHHPEARTATRETIIYPYDATTRTDFGTPAPTWPSTGQIWPRGDR